MKFNFNDQNQCMKLFGKPEISVEYYTTNSQGESVAVIEDAEGMIRAYKTDDMEYGDTVLLNQPIEQATNTVTPSFNNTQVQVPQQQTQVQQQMQSSHSKMIDTGFMRFPESLRLPDLKGRKSYNPVKENNIGEGNNSMPSLGIDFSVFGRPEWNNTPQVQQPAIPQGFVLKGEYPFNGQVVPCYTNPQWWTGNEKQADVWFENGVHYIRPHQQPQVQQQVEHHDHNCNCGHNHDNNHECNCGHHHDDKPLSKEEALAKKYKIRSNRINELVKANVLSDRLELKKAGKSQDEIDDIVAKNIQAGKYRNAAINELVKPELIKEEYNKSLREDDYKNLTNVPDDIKKTISEYEKQAEEYGITEQRIQYVEGLVEQKLKEQAKDGVTEEKINEIINENKSQGRYRAYALEQCIQSAIKEKQKEEAEFQQVMQTLMGGAQQAQPQQQVQQQMQPQYNLQQYQVMNVNGQDVMTYSDPSWWRQDIQPTSQQLSIIQGVYAVVPRYDYQQPMQYQYQQMGPAMYTGPYQPEPERPQRKSNIDWSKRITIHRPSSDPQQDACNGIEEDVPTTEQQSQPQYNVQASGYQSTPSQYSSENDKIAYINTLLNSCSSPEARQMVVNMLKQQGIVIPGISNDGMPDFSVFKNQNPNYPGNYPRQFNVKDPNFKPETVAGCDPLELMANMSYGDVDKLMQMSGSGVVVDNGVDESYDTSRPVYKQQMVGQEIPFDPYDIKNNFGNINENVRRMMNERLYQNTATNVPMYAGQPLTADNAIYVGGGRYVSKNPRPLYNPMMANQQARRQQEEYHKKQIEEAKKYKETSRIVSQALGREVDEERLDRLYDPEFLQNKKAEEKYWEDYKVKSDYERERDMRLRHCAMLSQMPSLQQMQDAIRERKLEEMARHQATFDGLSFFECIDKMNAEMAEEHYREMNYKNFKQNLRYLYNGTRYNDSFSDSMKLDKGEEYIEGTTIPMKYKDRYERWCKAMDEEWSDLIDG